MNKTASKIPSFNESKQNSPTHVRKEKTFERGWFLESFKRQERICGIELQSRTEAKNLHILVKRERERWVGMK